MENFKEIDDKIASKIEGGSLVAILTTLIPLGISLITNLLATIKATSSSEGELKTKDGNSFKWTNEAKESYVLPINYNL
ncbi:hypothetical protein [[Mycoplasma] gypis]|uniref:Uncharacterized protein n=1 Tax=[Mycoplasma] gypis TaxID=92404 RepID=A0ABZ2RU99_9BACT|nr:hypothetical protein [[Mycoplasma] gypis]MBN0919276.1 hypothetical protein [[Mycoplasma] gypis]